MAKDMVYPGIDADHYGGMTPIGTIIKDAWMFGLLPETETCAGWSHDRIQIVYDQVAKAWEPYGHMVSQLPEDLRARHERIHGEAMARARLLGWSAELGDDD